VDAWLKLVTISTHYKTFHMQIWIETFQPYLLTGCGFHMDTLKFFFMYCLCFVFLHIPCLLSWAPWFFVKQLLCCRHDRLWNKLNVKPGPIKSPNMTLGKCHVVTFHVLRPITQPVACFQLRQTACRGILTFPKEATICLLVPTV